MWIVCRGEQFIIVFAMFHGSDDGVLRGKPEQEGILEDGDGISGGSLRPTSNDWASVSMGGSRCHGGGGARGLPLGQTTKRVVDLFGGQGEFGRSQA